MNHYRTIKFDPDQWVMLTGKDKYELELVPGWLDLWFEWRSTDDVTAWLYFVDGKRVPYASGRSGHFSVRTLNVLSVVLETLKRATTCVCISYRDLAKMEKGDPTKLTVEVMPPAQLSLQESVRRELIKLGVTNDTIEVDDEDNLEDDIPEDEFGEGYMDPELPVEAPPSKKVRKPAEEPGQGGSHDSGSAEPKPDSGVVEAPKPLEPVKSES